MLTALLQVDKVDLDLLISECNYSDDFIRTANDLQILDAISECYEEYKILVKDVNFRILKNEGKSRKPCLNLAQLHNLYENMFRLHFFKF